MKDDDDKKGYVGREYKITVQLVQLQTSRFALSCTAIRTQLWQGSGKTKMLAKQMMEKAARIKSRKVLADIITAVHNTEGTSLIKL